MTKISTSSKRKIIKSFVDEIKKRTIRGAKPSKVVIEFRNERQNGTEREVVEVPTEILRFRKDNGRIISDVLSFEKNNYSLDETDKDDQEKIKEFLFYKDPQKTNELTNSLSKDGQKEPAIITADGFLINGNRRKMALELLQKKFPERKEFKYMKVVILPGENDSDQGGPPSLSEIEQIENRYQLQKDGKSEYYRFDTALSIRKKIQMGISLEEILRDDANYAALSQNEFKKELKKYEDDFLGPLDCIDDYLDSLGREGLYSTVSQSREEKEGRWQAFVDYYKSVDKKIISNEKNRIKLGIDEDEVGKIKDVAFKLIRKKDFPRSVRGGRGLYNIIRDMPSILADQDAKNELLKIAEISDHLEDDEKLNKKGENLKINEIDAIWSNKNESKIVECLIKATNYKNINDEIITPISLLESVLKNLRNPKLDLNKTSPMELENIKSLIKDIKEEIILLEKEHFDITKTISKANRVWMNH